MQSHRMTKLSLIKNNTKNFKGGVTFDKNTWGQWLRWVSEGNTGWGTTASIDSNCSPIAFTSHQPVHTHTYAHTHTHADLIHTHGKGYATKLSSCLPLPTQPHPWDSHCEVPPVRREVLTASTSPPMSAHRPHSHFCWQASIYTLFPASQRCSLACLTQVVLTRYQAMF